MTNKFIPTKKNLEQRIFKICSISFIKKKNESSTTKIVTSDNQFNGQANKLFHFGVSTASICKEKLSIGRKKKTKPSKAICLTIIAHNLIL